MNRAFYKWIPRAKLADWWVVSSFADDFDLI
jgi:hypothetical protein